MRKVPTSSCVAGKRPFWGALAQLRDSCRVAYSSVKSRYGIRGGATSKLLLTDGPVLLHDASVVIGPRVVLPDSKKKNSIDKLSIISWATAALGGARWYARY